MERSAARARAETDCVRPSTAPVVKRVRRVTCCPSRSPCRQGLATQRMILAMLMLSHVFLHRVQRLTNSIRIGPEKHLPAGFLAPEHAGLAQHLQVMRYCSARQRRRRDDLADVEALAGLEHQDDPLPVRIA